MGRFVPLLLAAAAAIAAASPAPEKFASKLDHVNVEDVLRNERLLNKYIQCLLSETGDGCTAEGYELREIIPEAVTNDCIKCNEKQRAEADRVIHFLQREKPPMWAKLRGKYDPQGLYSKHYA